MQGLRTLLIVAVLLCQQLLGAVPKKPANYYSNAEIAAFTEAAKDGCGKGLIIGIGGGFDSQKRFQPLADRCIAHSGKEHPNMLFVPTAHHDNPDESAEEMQWFADSGCQTDVLYVSKVSAEEAKEKIAWADIIYETGGSLQFLTEQWSEKGVMEAVSEAFDRGASLIGESSGAMCWAQRGFDDCGEPIDRPIGSFPFHSVANSYVFFDCAGIIPFCVSPHYDNFGWRMFALETVKLDIPSVAIENGAALVYENGKYEIISDSETPLRTAFLFNPARGLKNVDIRTNGVLAVLSDGESRAARVS